MQTQWPMLLAFASFVVTFLVTRLVTRLIRAGKGPFKDNVSEDGVHVDYAVYGSFALLAGALVNTGATMGAFRRLGAILIGAGASLILDEFALILHLRDVYWEHEGRASVQAVALTSGCLGLACTGFVPLAGDDFNDDGAAVASALIVMALIIASIWVCARKGKFRLVLLAIFFRGRHSSVLFVSHVAGHRGSSVTMTRDRPSVRVRTSGCDVLMPVGRRDGSGSPTL